MRFFQEFKEFVNRGNTIDLAVGVVIGGAFGTVVSSLVNDVILPPLSLLFSGVNLKEYVWTLKPATATATAVTLSYGNFLQAGFNFLVVSVSIFIVIKLLGRLRRKEPKKEVHDPEEVKLLREIRDLLKKAR